MKTLFSAGLCMFLLSPAGLAQPLCKTWEAASRHLGQRVVLVGRYQPLPPQEPSSNSGIPDFRPGPRAFGRVQIVLPDGEVFLNPPLHKTSLRSPEEREDYGDRWVRVVGVPGLEGERHLQLERLQLDLTESKLYAPRSLFAAWSQQGLKSWRFVAQKEGRDGDPWDLIREYRVEDRQGHYRLNLYRYPAGAMTPPPEMPDGEQVAYSSAGTPAYVGRLQIVSESVSGQLLAWLAAEAFAIDAEQQLWLKNLKRESAGRWEHNGLVVEAGAEGVEMWHRAPLQQRRSYLELEPRDSRL